MAHSSQVELLAALPDALKARSTDLSAMGSAEFAFPADCLDEVFRVLVAAGFVILGGDLWRMTASGFMPAHQSWYIRRAGDDPESAWSQFVRAVPEGEEYFATFVVQ